MEYVRRFHFVLTTLKEQKKEVDEKVLWCVSDEVKRAHR